MAISLPSHQSGEGARDDDGDELADCLQRLAAGDASALDQLISQACKRMEDMAHRMLRRFPKVRRWVETKDVVQDASLALWKRLKKTPPPADPRQYVGLCAIEVHHRLLDLARKFSGPQSFASKHQTNHGAGVDGQRLTIEAQGVIDTWTEELQIWRLILETLERQPSRVAQAFRLVHFLGVKRRQAAEQLGVDRKTVDRDLALAQEAIDTAVQGDG